MVNQAEEPLRKVTLNLFESDVLFLIRAIGPGWTEYVRRLVRNDVEYLQDIEEEAKVGQ